jgi:putative transposase
MSEDASWEISDLFWQQVEPLIPQQQRPDGLSYRRRVGGGRKPKDPRLVLGAILVVLRSGIQWKELPQNPFGSASAIHAYFQRWEQHGVFEKMFAAGLAETDEMAGIAWRWQDTRENEISETGKHGRGAARCWRPVVNRRSSVK